MFRISQQAYGALEAQARPAYVERLRVQLAETYPHLLPRFPDELGRRIVANMLGRASAWGLSRQRGFAMWCGWMIAIAPNFDEEPEINRALAALPEPRELGLSRLPSTVSPMAWDRAEAQSSVLPLFVPPMLAQAPMPDQLAAALPIVLFGQPEAADPLPLARHAIEQAGAMGLAGLADAPLVIAACLSFWGPQWTSLPWAEGLRRSRVGGRELLAALRCRLALEFGRFA